MFFRFGSVGGTKWDVCRYVVSKCVKECLSWLCRLSADRYPKLGEYCARLKDRPSIKASWPPHWLENQNGQDDLKDIWASGQLEQRRLPHLLLSFDPIPAVPEYILRFLTINISVLTSGPSETNGSLWCRCSRRGRLVSNVDGPVQFLCMFRPQVLNSLAASLSPLFAWQ